MVQWWCSVAGVDWYVVVQLVGVLGVRHLSSGLQASREEVVRLLGRRQSGGSQASREDQILMVNPVSTPCFYTICGSALIICGVVS